MLLFRWLFMSMFTQAFSGGFCGPLQIRSVISFHCRKGAFSICTSTTPNTINNAFRIVCHEPPVVNLVTLHVATLYLSLKLSSI
ncbi:hypothetical protein BGZ57DRAFT_887409 [Hyaloscypha finlandica]|nr:hypothetical protein BGZ57DRAFT_887409 [Hyaloscypha finlandica]